MTNKERAENLELVLYRLNLILDTPGAPASVRVQAKAAIQELEEIGVMSIRSSMPAAVNGHGIVSH